MIRGRGCSAAGVLATAALLLAGCGSSSLSLVQLRSRATAICATADRRLQAIPPPASEADGIRFLGRGIGALTPQVRGLKALSPPSEVRADYTRAVQAMSSELTALGSAVGSLRGGADPVATFRALESRVRPLQAQADSAWRALQIPACTTH